MSQTTYNKTLAEGNTVEELNARVDQLRKRIVYVERMLKKTAPHIPQEKSGSFYSKFIKNLKAA